MEKEENKDDDQYRDFAFVYDELMNDVDYDKWVKYIEDIIDNENVKVKNILELACGTGNITIPLAKKRIRYSWN